MAKFKMRGILLAGAILVVGSYFAATPSTSHAQCGVFGWNQPWMGYNAAYPSAYSTQRYGSYYTSSWGGAGWGNVGYGYGLGSGLCNYGGPWCGYELPYYSPAFSYATHPWIWNRHSRFMVRGFVAPQERGSVKVVANPFYKPSQELPPPVDAPAAPAESAPAAEAAPTARIVRNPFYVAK